MAIPEIKLTAEDKAMLEALGADIAGLEREVAKAEAAELDAAPKLREDFEKMKKRRELILKVYG